MILASIIITSVTVLVMAEEFNQLPKYLQNFSSMLVHNRNSRNILICGIIIIMSTSISLSLLAFTNKTNVPNKVNNESDVQSQGKDLDTYDIRTSFLKSNRPIIISNLNIYENGLQPNNYEPENNDNEGNGLAENRIKQEIILNLFLTANIHHNITLNGIQMNDMLIKNCEMNCDEQRIKDIIRKYIEMIKITNNSTSEIDLEEKLTYNTTDYNELNCSSNTDECMEHKIEKRSVLPEANVIRRYVRDTSENTNDESCRHPDYIVFMWVLCLIALATALKLYYLIKTVLAVAMVLLFSMLILTTDVFDEEIEMINNK